MRTLSVSYAGSIEEESIVGENLDLYLMLAPSRRYR